MEGLCHLVIVIIITSAFVVPSLVVAGKDKDLDFWATRDGVKDQCGKLYNVTLGDAIAILVSGVLFTILIICTVLNMGTMVQ
ncbi:hypothetical protein M0811_12173 [Anaeramoeba ignava]|uniref:Uncharacterized protein n=1 Tax=Anaeramoeba ignava TaxID=1746090 RepID=A0A9Q0L9M2_ANAIG|nr:hypothetical protein M0811_12173 [Anaeramoeba ignava]